MCEYRYLPSKLRHLWTETRCSVIRTKVSSEPASGQAGHVDTACAHSECKMHHRHFHGPQTSHWRPFSFRTHNVMNCLSDLSLVLTRPCLTLCRDALGSARITCIHGHQALQNQDRPPGLLSAGPIPAPVAFLYSRLAAPSAKPSLLPPKQDITHLAKPG